jgi:hypothetical protein
MKNDSNASVGWGQRLTARHGECDRMERQRLPDSSAAEMAPCFAAADLFFVSPERARSPLRFRRSRLTAFRIRAWLEAACVEGADLRERGASSFPTVTSAVKVVPQRAEPWRSGRGGPARAGEHRALQWLLYICRQSDRCTLKLLLVDGYVNIPGKATRE